MKIEGNLIKFESYSDMRDYLQKMVDHYTAEQKKLAVVRDYNSVQKAEALTFLSESLRMDLRTADVVALIRTTIEKYPDAFTLNGVIKDWLLLAHKECNQMEKLLNGIYELFSPEREIPLEEIPQLQAGQADSKRMHYPN